LLMLSATQANPAGQHLPWLILTAWTAFLALLGVSLAIPMKRNMINQERLPFPSGIAAAATLRSLYAEGQSAVEQGKKLLIAAGVGALFPLLIDLQLKAVSENGELKWKTLADGTKTVVRQPLLEGVSALYAGGVFRLFDFLPVFGQKKVDGRLEP